MRKTPVLLRLVVPAVLLFASPIAPAFAAASPADAPALAPVPTAILTAKKLFIANGGADNGLFPLAFSGEPSRGYNQFYSALQATGEYQLVSDPSQADLVLELRLAASYSTIPENMFRDSPKVSPLVWFRLVIYDRQSHYVLWELTQSAESAILQKTRNRNFDEALQRLTTDFLTLAHPKPPVH